MHDFAQQHEVDVAVDEAGGRAAVVGLFDEGAADAGVVAGPGRVEIEIRAEAGKMGHQIANGDGAFAALELGQVGVTGSLRRSLPCSKSFIERGGGGDSPW